MGQASAVRTDGADAGSSSADRPFTFASGNRSKILGLPRYALGSARSAITRRDPRLWVIGSHFGLGDGALAFLNAARLAHRGLRLVWLVATEADARRATTLGIDWCARDSSAGLELTLRAGVAAVTHGFGDVNRYGLRGATIVQLWHGSPLKKLHLDSPAALNVGRLGTIPGVRPMIREMYRRGTRQISLFPVAAQHFVPSICSAFDLTPTQVMALGEPRTDVLFAGSIAERIARARALLADRLPGLGDRRVVLYAPTWRDGEPDPSIPSPAQWARIEDVFRRSNRVLAVRPHPLGVGAYRHSSDVVRLLTADQQPESMPLLWGLDALITDYSSMLFDMAVTGAPMIFLAPDLEHYAASRGLYENYAEITGGRWSTSWDQVLDRIEGLEDPQREQRLRDHSASLAETFHDHHDGRNAERVVQQVLQLRS
ncbi:MAG: CDP-glycerol glycerophosphotransferase family protein [Micropruina sp.]